MRRLSHIKFLSFFFFCLLLMPQKSFAWGAEGHAIVAELAMHCLPEAKQAKIKALLKEDKSLLVPTSLEGEASFPDSYWPLHPETLPWHYVNNDWKHPNVLSACPPIESAEKGGCVLNRIEYFRKILKDQNASLEKKLFALQFIIHLVGDMHQPLHAISDKDRGGTQKFAVVSGQLVPTNFASSLHTYWDTNFIVLEWLGRVDLEQKLIAEITPKEIQSWQKGSVWDWSREAYKLGARDGYAALPKAHKDGLYVLDEIYVHQAQKDIHLQLKRAAVRLAMILEESAF
ncbi:hypothetical protein FAI40_07505 [Acetobacteraceae bacterium]|nr:hypothetical protein FAI40_07505 [Acetobacteraceae bacterium]